MKRLVITIVLSLSLVASVFANKVSDFFGNRFFEVNVGADLGISTNTFELPEYFKEELIIDLRKIADTVPETGMSSAVTEKGLFSLKINIPHGLLFNVDVGQTLYMDTTVSKDLFSFLGYGNVEGDDLNIKIDGYTDAFVYLSASLGWQFDKLSFLVTPTAFLPLFHGKIFDTYAKLDKTEDNVFVANMQANMDVYSFTGISMEMPDFQEILSNTAGLFNSIGYDLSLHVDWDAFQYLSFYFDTRVPIVPGHLSKSTPLKASFSYEKALKDLTSKADDSSSSDDLSSNPDEDDSAFKYSFETPVDIDPYAINRPMKFFLGTNFHPFQDVMFYYGGVGMAFSHPFAADSSDRGFYMEYLLGLRLSCFNILNLDVTTEYTDKIFAHSAQVGFNLRFLEVDLGISSQSSDFVKSFQAAGLGAFVNACIGF